MSTWLAGTGSVRGAHHKRRGAPNEDHARARVDDTAAIVSVADGHGAPQYRRADRGARLATQAAVEVLTEVATGPVELDLQRLPAALVERWRQLVAADLGSDPPERTAVGRHRPHELYGTTVLGAAQLRDGLLLVQLGDGDIVLGRCDRPTQPGQPRTHRPIPAVEHAFPGATDSLVQDDATDHVRVALVPPEDFDPEVVLLATDGLDAARPGRGWHGEVIAETCQRLGTTRPDEFGDAVGAWCREPARTGGDDTTMALLVRPHLLSG